MQVVPGLTSLSEAQPGVGGKGLVGPHPDALRPLSPWLICFSEAEEGSSGQAGLHVLLEAGKQPEEEADTAPCTGTPAAHSTCQWCRH